MCGIAGFVSNMTNRENVISEMLARIVHRGPDAEGVYINAADPVVLGHRRLSIVDLSANGSQPMLSHSGRYVISYNGEIYNAEMIKKHMADKGYHIEYRGTSDTEVLLEAFELLGIENTLSLAKGMFALALYDRESKCLYLMRDRIGEKPLFYGYLNGDFVFASEITQLESYPGFKNAIDEEALAEFIRTGYITSPKTIYEGIHKLIPGTILKLEAPYNKPEVSYYWNIREIAATREGSFMGSYEEAVEELNRLLTDSVKEQMMADVPLGAYLSAGIDSSVIVSVMTELSERKIKTFTIGFDDEKYNEAVYASKIAEHLGTEHTEMYVSEQELKAVIPKLTDMYGEPFADSSQIPTYYVSKLAKSKVTVSLSGDAGDELFCGYRTYDKLLPVWNKTRSIPYGLRNVLGGAGRALSFGNNKLGRASYCMGAANIVAMKEELGHTSLNMDRLVGHKHINNREMLLKDELNSLMLDDMIHYHPDDILVKVDRAGMAVSLENRIPMLDRDVVEFAFSLPVEYKYDGEVSKKILKDVLYKYVPKSLMDRPKKGFSVPLTKWLTTGEVGEMARQYMMESRAGEDGILDDSILKQVWARFEKGKEPSRFVWNLVMFEQWYRSRRK